MSEVETDVHTALTFSRSAPEPVPAAPALEGHYIEMPSEDELLCKYPGCGFKAKNQSGKTLHYNATHGAKPRKNKVKEAAPVKPSVDYGERRATPAKQTVKGLKEVYYDGESRVLFEDEDGEWWCAMPLDVD